MSEKHLPPEEYIERLVTQVDLLDAESADAIFYRLDQQKYEDVIKQERRQNRPRKIRLGIAMGALAVCAFTVGSQWLQASQESSNQRQHAEDIMVKLDELITQPGMTAITDDFTTVDSSNYPFVSYPASNLDIVDQSAEIGVSIPGCTLNNVEVDYTIDASGVPKTITGMSTYGTTTTQEGRISFTDLYSLSQQTQNDPCHHVFSVTLSQP